jgi:hypothetical protein
VAAQPGAAARAALTVAATSSSDAMGTRLTSSPVAGSVTMNRPARQTPPASCSTSTMAGYVPVAARGRRRRFRTGRPG